MWTALIFLVTTVALFSLSKGACFSFEKDYYEELGCKVKTSDAAGCPTSYDCSSLEKRNKAKCYYNGLEYDLDDVLATSPATACLANCRCLNITNQAKFTCARVECPEHMGVRIPPDCYRFYEHRKCCMVKKICGEEAKLENQKFVCDFKGKSYMSGQKFYPEDGSCLKCICQEGFNGSLVEPFCLKTKCNLELVSWSRITAGCVPIYYGEQGCCPIGWRCPEDSDTVVPVSSNSSPASTTDSSCKFGKLSLKVGETLSQGREVAEVTCSCRVPPHPVCIQKAQTAPA